MKYEKSIATFLAGLMSLVSIVYPVLAATNLGQYPSFLLNSDGSLNAYVVYGSSASSQDVLAGTDIVARLAQQAATSVNVPGSSAAITGVEKNTIGHNYGNFTDVFPNPVTSGQYSGFQQSTISYKGNQYNYHEDLQLGNTYFSHDFSTSGINGTETMVMQGNQVMYEYVFDSALNCTALATTTQNTCTLTNPEYTNPVKIWLLGKPFVIVGIGSNQVIMLSGSVGTATSTSGVTFGSYTVYSDLGNNGNWARVIVKDASGNTVETRVINQGDSFDFSAENITVKVTNARALQDGTVVGTDVVVGSIGAVQHTYTTSCDVTTTGSSATIFPGETSWCIQVSGFANSGAIASGDKLQVSYRPQVSPQYFKYTGSTVTLPLPNNYGEIGFKGFGGPTFATLTFKEVEGISGYFTTSPGTTNSTVAASNLNGIEIDSNVNGELVDPTTNTGYNRAYILFNTSISTTNFPVMLGFYDSSNSRVGVNVTGCSIAATNMGVSNIGGITRVAQGYCAQLNGTNFAQFNVTLSYGGSAASKDQQVLFVNVTGPTNAVCQASGGSACAGYFSAFQLGDLTTGNPPYVAYPAGTLINWVNKTTTWSTSQPPTFRLYTTDSSETKDVQVLNLPSGGGAAAYADIGQSTQDVVANNGVIITAPASYTGGNQVIVQVPSTALAVDAYVGKMGAGASAIGTYSQVVPITQSITRLDSEVTSADESSHDLVLVGGPCVNTLVASLATASGNSTTAEFPYTCASWPGRNFARIQVVDNAFATGHQALVVAGTRAADTRVAGNVLQQYDTLLKGITSQAVEVTSASASGITPA